MDPIKSKAIRHAALAAFSGVASMATLNVAVRTARHELDETLLTWVMPFVLFFVFYRSLGWAVAGFSGKLAPWSWEALIGRWRA